jgi:hypothetical protein
MRQGIQSELKDSWIKEYGCYFLCILAIAEADSGKPISDQDILNIKNIAMGRGYIGKDDLIYNEVAIYDLWAAHEYDTIEKPEVKGYTGKLPNSYIVCNKKPMYTHFDAIINMRKWDPLPPDRPASNGYAPFSYRIFRKVNYGKAAA